MIKSCSWPDLYENQRQKCKPVKGVTLVCVRIHHTAQLIINSYFQSWKMKTFAFRSRIDDKKRTWWMFAIVPHLSKFMHALGQTARRLPEHQHASFLAVAPLCHTHLSCSTCRAKGRECVSAVISTMQPMTKWITAWSCYSARWSNEVEAMQWQDLTNSQRKQPMGLCKIDTLQTGLP